MMSVVDLASRGVVGLRFHPTDEELVDHYMKLKMDGRDDEISGIITEIDICKYEPRELPRRSLINSENDTWYFFCRPDYKYTNSRRFNRTTKEGSWKVTGRDRMIKGKGRRNKKVIGFKKTLVFHEHNKPKAIKTNWVIHEYHSIVTNPNQREIILCRLKYEPDVTDISSSDEGEPSQQQIVYDLEDYDLEDEIDDTIMSEAYDSLVAEKMAEFASLIGLNQNAFEMRDEPANQNSFQINDELLFNTPVPERAQLFVNSFPPLDQDAYSYEGIFQDYSPAESSSRERVRSPRVADCEVNYMVEPRGGLPLDTRTSTSQYRSQNVIAERYFQADFDDSSSKVTSRIQPREEGGPSKSQNKPKPRNYERVESPASMELQKYSAPKAPSRKKAKEAEGQGDTDDLKGSIVVDSNKSSKMAESSNSRSLKKSQSPRALGLLGKNCFIVLEPSPLDLIQQPPSVYIFNLVVGIFLFLVFLRDLMVLH